MNAETPVKSRLAGLFQATRRLTALERSCIYFLVAVVLGFGILVEIRSAFLSRRMGDLGCYLRGAWAVRVGADMYGLKENNGWHYNYPPLYAILMTPLADPPPGASTAGFVPYPISVLIVYTLNVAFLLLAVHTLANVLEEKSPSLSRQPRYCRRWWTLRLWPMLICLPTIGQTVMRGQVNTLILALLCGFIAGVLRGQRFRAGILLALAICIKVIPIYLLVYPVWKRDGRALLGCMLGLFLGLAAVPFAALGPTRMRDQYERYAAVLFGPLFQVTEDTSRQEELLGMNATDSMGIKHALHNWMYFDQQYHRPETYHPVVVWTHRLLGVLMTLATLWPGNWPRAREPGAREAFQFSALIVLMVFFSPISHLHYYVFCLPVVLGLLARQWEGRPRVTLGPGLTLALLGFFLGNLIPSLPGCERMKDLCLVLFGALPLWGLLLREIWRRERNEPAPASVTPSLARAA